MNAGPGFDADMHDWCARLFARVLHLRGVRLRLHADREQFATGDIFLLDAATPVTGFLPQYCLFEATGTRCRAVAPGEATRGDPVRGRLLGALGVTGAGRAGLEFELAFDLLAGRRVICAADGRGHDGGAARLATALAVLFAAVRRHLAAGRHDEVAHWAEQLGMSSASRLAERVARPVVLVPVRIDRYPLPHASGFMRKLAATWAGRPSDAELDALLAGNDPFEGARELDLRCGAPLAADVGWRFAERAAARWLATRLRAPRDAFAENFAQSGPTGRLAARRLSRAAAALREHALAGLHEALTVNVEHLAAALLHQRRGPATVTLETARLARLVYVAAKRLQGDPGTHLHQSLCKPARYSALADGDATTLSSLLDAAAEAGWLRRDGATLRLLPVTMTPPAGDVVTALAGAALARPAIRRAVTAATDALAEEAALPPALRTALAVDDLRVEHDWDRRAHDRPKHRAINAQQTATADAAPFLLEPARARPLGVLLVHGFLASPAEMRPLAERLRDERFRVLGVRLRGHGTSPWDLERRSWEDWLASLVRGFELLRETHGRVAVVGFSTGAALALLHAAGVPSGLAGVVACAPPLRLRNPRMRAVPVVHGVNRLLGRITQSAGPIPFRPNRPEHPDVNYRHMPLQGLHELKRLVQTLEPRLGAVRCPALVLQATDDPVVEHSGAEMLYAALGSAEKALHWVPARRHGILRANIGDAHARISGFLQEL
jgi:esterase/lipase